MYKASILTLLLSINLSLSGCGKNKTEITIVNSLDIPRNFETVELTRKILKLKSDAKLKGFGIADASGNSIIIQYVDKNQDGVIDMILFQPKLKAHSKATYTLVKRSTNKNMNPIVRCFSRFVPERTDDYAWENNKVAFRTYGPKAQEMVEKNIPGGTLSSGVDAWLKKVEYPIINRWYKKTLSGQGSYHKDTGEGLDNYHVGVSRGVGGTAIKKDSVYHTSPNFSEWETLTNGPIRTSFILTYYWKMDGKPIKEEKHITLDYGSNLTRYEIKVNGTDKLSAGLSLHEKNGRSTVNMEEGWLSYWEPHYGSKLGTGMVIPQKYLKGYEKYITNKKDSNNLYAQMEVKDEKVIFFAGFGWKKSGQFKSREEWEQYLTIFTKKLKNPLKVSVN